MRFNNSENSSADNSILYDPHQLNNLFGYFEQFTNPTNVDHSLYCNAISTTEKHLIIVRSHVLEIYSIIKDETKTNVDDSVNKRFNLIASEVLPDDPFDIVSVRFNTHSLDSLIISFKDAKIAIVNIDPLTLELKTISLHNYEFENLKNGQFIIKNGPILRIDPQQRCAVALVYDSQIAVLPFRRPENIDFDMNFLGFDKLENNRNGPICSTYTVNLTKIFNDQITNIKDMKFLHGFYQPTLLVLYEPVGTWAGLISSRKDTCCVVALSFNLQRRTNPVIWFVENLPYDCITIQPVLKPQVGALIIATNSIIYIKQTHPSQGMSLNCYGKSSSNFLMKLPIPNCGPLTMDGVKMVPINSTDYLFGLANGNFYVLSLWIDELTNYLVSFIINFAGQYVAPQSITLLDGSHIFIGSRNSSSYLYHFEPNTALMNVKGDLYEEKINQEDEEEDDENKDEPLVEGEESTVQKVDENEKKEAKEEPKEEEQVPKFNDEDIMLYGAAILEKPMAYRSMNLFKLTKCDELLHIGPISNLSAGEVTDLTHGSVDSSDDCLQLAQSEFGANELLGTLFPRTFPENENQFNGLLALQRTVKSKAVMTFEIPHHTSLWSLASQDNSSKVKSTLNEFGEEIKDELDEIKVEANSKIEHSHLLLSSEESTMILEIGKEIVELEVSGFSTAEATIAAFNFYFNVDEKILHSIQVCPTSVRVLRNSKLIEHVQITREWPIHFVSHCDPYILLCSEDDELILLRSKDFPVEEVSEESEEFDANNLDEIASKCRHFDITKPSVGQVSPVIAVSLYCDRVGNLTEFFKKNYSSKNAETSGNPMETSLNLSMSSEKSSSEKKNKNPLKRVDEEDLFIYGQIIGKSKVEEGEKKERKLSKMDVDSTSDSAKPCEINMESSAEEVNFITNYFAFVVFSNGTLEVYSLPSCRIIYQVKSLSLLPQFLVEDSSNFASDLKGSITRAMVNLNFDPNVSQEDFSSPIQEIILSTIGLNRDRHILYIRTHHEIVMYEAISNLDKTYRDLIWHRLQIPCLLIPPRKISQETQSAINQSKYLSRNSLMTRFEDLSENHSGIFVAGIYPVWIFSSDIGVPRVFHNSITGVISSFSPLNCEICPNGFIILTQTNEMRLSTLLKDYNYHHEVGFKKIAMQEIVQFIQYHVESKIYAVISYLPVTTNSIFKLNQEGAKEKDTFQRPDSCVFPSREQYYLRLYSSELSHNSPDASSWDLIPNATIEFEPWEVVSCFNTVRLRQDQNATESKDFLAIGANLVYGEEIPVRGRILLLDIVHVVPELNQPLTAHKLKCFHDNEEKGPITALSSCDGFLISAIGQKVFIWSLSDSNLTGVAFVDTDLFIHSMVNIRGIIIAADIMKSVHMLRFQNDFRVLSLLAKESVTREIYTLNFFVDNKKLGIISSDEYGNLIISNYDPLNKLSYNGRRLIRRADFKMPSRAISCIRVCNSISHPLLVTMRIIKNSQNLRDSERERKTTELKENGSLHEKTPTVANLVKSLNSGSFASNFMHSVDEENELLKHTVYYAGQNGSFSKINSIKEKVHNRLRIVERNLTQFNGPKAGLLTKFTRQYKRPFPEMENVCNNIINGDAINKFLLLSHTQRVEVAKKSGQTWKAILDDIADIKASTLHF